MEIPLAPMGRHAISLASSPQCFHMSLERQERLSPTSSEQPHAQLKGTPTLEAGEMTQSLRAPLPEDPPLVLSTRVVTHSQLQFPGIRCPLLTPTGGAYTHYTNIHTGRSSET